MVQESSSRRFDDARVRAVFAHELIHLYQARSWLIEQSTGSERLTRIGLTFFQGDVMMWNWVNEAVTDELTEEEYRRIENAQYQVGYGYYIGQFHKMSKALSANSGKSPKEIKEIFRNSSLGAGKLLPLRDLIRPPFKSLEDFVKTTEAPMNFSLSPDGPDKVYDALWQEVSAGNAGTHLQEQLKADQELLMKYQQIIRDATTALRQKDSPDMAREKVRAVLEIPKVDWILSEDEKQGLVEFMDGKNGQIRDILNHMYHFLPVAVFYARYPKLRELINSKPAAEIEDEEWEPLYLEALGIQKVAN